MRLGVRPRALGRGEHRHGHGGVWRPPPGACTRARADGCGGGQAPGNREPDLATFARICRALATTPDEILEFGSHGEAGAEAEPERRRALAAVEAMDGRALKIAAVVLESIATRQDEL